jgi:hypothetical protein
VPAASKGKEPLPLREALSREYLITQPTPKFLRAIAERASAAPLLKELLHPERKHDLDQYLWGMEVIDFLLQHHSVQFTPEEFVGPALEVASRVSIHLLEPQGLPRRGASHRRRRPVPKVTAACAAASAPAFSPNAPMNLAHLCSSARSKFRMPEDG